MIERTRKDQTFRQIMSDLLAIDEAWDREVMAAYLEYQEAQRAA